MKKPSMAAPVSLTAALACLISLNMGCEKDNSPAVKPSATPKPASANPGTTAADTNSAVKVSAAAPASPTHAETITNPPLAPTTPVAAPTTPEPAPTASIPAAAKPTIVEMPSKAPTAPTNFYSGDFDKKSSCCMTGSGSDADDYFSLRFRAGYQHVNHGDNNDTYYVSAKFAVNGDKLRANAGRNAWLVPDAYAEIAHQYLPKPDASKHPGSGEGIQFRADFFWPWMHWTSQMFARTNSVCPMCRPLTLGFGPTANLGFDQLFDGSEARLARYAGVRMTINDDGFIEYTAGGTDGLCGTRNQVVTELPFYVSHKNGVRYYFRGVWNSGYNSTHDELEAGLFVELPLETLISPCKWGSLIPGKK
jgi:hypothetical protein